MSQHVQQLFEGGIKAHRKSLQPEAREECFHETSVGYEALGALLNKRQRAKHSQNTGNQIYFFFISPVSSEAAQVKSSSPFPHVKHPGWPLQ